MPATRHRRPPRRASIGPAPRPVAGFTLIELMVVLGLLAILTAMIVPEMRGSHRDALLRSSSRQLVNACALASSRAVSLGQSHRVRLDPATGRFQLERQAPGSRSARTEPAYVPIRDIPHAAGRLDPRIAVRLRQPDLDPVDRPEADPFLPDWSVGDPAGSFTRPADPDPFAEAGPESDSMADGPSGPAMGVLFHADGTADRVEIRLRDPDGFGLALRVNPVTARIRIIPLERP
ncbi:MAG: prepilin-type N-terminal cleavage/methylation domain-containing protein [Verrucomicrobiae bacterium]|nr:prepilin-type N-terminal cleavage/methylation domain-containing protein [Verrucomicrobiae bacterium]